MITSVNNKSVKEVVQLVQKAKVRREQDVFIAEGAKMFQEAPDERIRKVFVAQSAERELLNQYGDKLTKTGYEAVADEVFRKMSDTKTPQGILCLIRQYHYALEEILEPEKRKEGQETFLLILENIQDPGNLGTLFRTGEGAGVDGIIMSRQTADIYNPKVVRSTMGSIYRVPFVYAEDLGATIGVLRDKGISVYAAHLAGKRFYDEFDYTKRTAFLIGNEANGLEEETARLADYCLKIPMQGQLESLNAAVASAVLMYEAQRQRRAGKKINHCGRV